MNGNSRKISITKDVHSAAPAPKADVALRTLTFLAVKGQYAEAPAPEVPAYAKAGFIPPAQAGIDHRTFTTLSVAALFVLTFILGITGALLWAGAGRPELAAGLAGLQAHQMPDALIKVAQRSDIIDAPVILSGNKLRMLRATMSSDIESSLLLQAAAEGRIDLPPSTQNADGMVDMHTMISDLVQGSLTEDGTPEATEPARELSRKIFAASTVQSKCIGGKSIYIVAPGDSLAYIAPQFYGKPSVFKRILEANRDTLQSPEDIQLGQRLIIPS